MIEPNVGIVGIVRVDLDVAPIRCHSSSRCRMAHTLQRGGPSASCTASYRVLSPLTPRRAHLECRCNDDRGRRSRPLCAVLASSALSAREQIPRVSESRRRFDRARGRHQFFADTGECYPHDSFTNLLISPGAAKTIDARSPCIPAPTMTGFPGLGPRSLASVLKRRLNSQTLFTLPSAVCTA